MEEVAATGRVVYIGWAKEAVTYETKLFILKELDIISTRNSLTEFPDVIDMLQRRQFPVEATISRTVRLEEPATPCAALGARRRRRMGRDTSSKWHEGNGIWRDRWHGPEGFSNRFRRLAAG